ncbi:MAG TPA: hypothetical protein VI953_01215 [Candidatus Paceibacterota bacterium]
MSTKQESKYAKADQAVLRSWLIGAVGKLMTAISRIDEIPIGLEELQAVRRGSLIVLQKRNRQAFIKLVGDRFLI